MIERPLYLDKIMPFVDTPFVKILTGVRRCGKSTILKIIIKKIKEEKNVEDEQILNYCFNSMEYEDMTTKELYLELKSKIIQSKKTYLFLDEIQEIEGWEKVVNTLASDFDIDIYITGSNSYIFSGQLATYLSGRYIEIPILPLSFKEIYSPHSNKEEAFQKYMKTGGFPYINQIQLNNEQTNMYLEGIYNTVIVKDIEERINRKNNGSDSKNVTDIALLKAISKYLSSVVGSPVSVRSITNYFKSNERKTSPNTISNYIEALCESYLYYPVEVMDISGKEVLKSNKKYYIVDPGIRNYILPKQSYDLGFTIENIVYLELLRRRYIVNIGQSGHTEVDFIAKRNDVYTYIQVTASLVDENTFNREIRPLKLIKDNYEKIILTLDRYTLGNYDGIKVINLLDWLLEE